MWNDGCEACYYEQGFADACFYAVKMLEVCPEEDNYCIMQMCEDNINYLSQCAWDECYEGNTYSFLGFCGDQKKNIADFFHLF